MLIFSLYFLLAQQLFAKNLPVQGRVFLGATAVEPDQVNVDLVADGFEDIDAIGNLGVEILFPINKYLDLGIRYTQRSTVSYDSPNNPLNDYGAELSQEAALAVARVSLLKSKIFRADLFAGFGLVQLKTVNSQKKILPLGLQALTRHMEFLSVLVIKRFSCM
jgi:hypothetical protein